MGKSEKKQCLKSSGNTAGLPSDVSSIVHIIINKIHTYGASSSTATPLQLKSRLPTFYNLNRSVDRALSAGNAKCCLVAECLYVSSSSSSSSQSKTAAERKRASRENAEYRESEQMLNSTRRKSRRQDCEYRQQEQTEDTRRRKTSRQDCEYRQQEQTEDTSRRKTRRVDPTYRQEERTQRREHNCTTTAQLVCYFRQLIASGPVYICTACDQLFYKHSVKSHNDTVIVIACS